MHARESSVLERAQGGWVRAVLRNPKARPVLCLRILKKQGLFLSRVVPVGPEWLGLKSAALCRPKTQDLALHPRPDICASGTASPGTL